ncbi:MAG: HYR domain-containing protein, partial [Bacteroidota bacterium]
MKSILQSTSRGKITKIFSLFDFGKTFCKGRISLMVMILLFLQTTVFAQAPTVSSTNLTFSNLDGDRFIARFTRGNGQNRIIIASESPVTAIPVDGADYLAGNFGLGNEISPGQFVVYKGNADATWLYGFNHSTTYYLKIFEYNGSNFTTEYLTDQFLEGSVTTLTGPNIQASNLTFSNVTGNSMTLNWTIGDGTSRMILARVDAPVDGEPVDLSNYGASSSFGSGSQVGAGNYVIYSGSGTSMNLSNLSPNRTYHFSIFEYNGSSGKIYLRPGATGNQLTASAPTVPASNFSTRSIDGNRLIYEFTRGNGTRRVVIAKKGSPVTAVPVDGEQYAGNDIFGSGTEISEGEFVVHDGTGSAMWLYGLDPNSTYHFAVFEYNGTGSGTFYLTDPYLTGTGSTLTGPTVQANELTFSNVTGNSMTLNWTIGDGTSRMILARVDAPVDGEPVDLSNYGASSSFGSGSQVGPGNYVIYSGSGTSMNLSNLSPNRTYHFSIFEYNGSSGKIYLRPGATGNQLTASAPTVPASNFSTRSIDGNRFIYEFTRGNGTRRVVIAKKGSPVTAVPIDGEQYSGNDIFGSGTEISEGEFVVHDGTGSAMWLYGLEPNSTYHFSVFEYNGTGSGTFYLTDPYLTGTGSTLTGPTVQASELTFSNVTGNSMTLNWTKGDGTSRMILARVDAPVDGEPVDLSNYGASSSFGSGNQVGPGNYVIYNGSGTSMNLSNLSPNRTYHFSIFEYNGSSGKIYLRPGGATGNQLTASAPTIPASNFSTRSIDGNRFIYEFTRGNGTRRVVIAKKGSPVTAVPVDGEQYAGNDIFGSGTEISEGEFVVHDGTGSAMWLYGLEPNSTYHFSVFEYNGTGSGTFYLSAPYLAGLGSTISSPTVQSSNAFTSSRSNTSINISWTRGDGSNRILIGRKDGPVNIEPQDLTTYSTSATFGSSWTQIGTENYGLYVGTGNNVNITNLEPGTNYYFALFEYNGNSAKLYLRPGYQFALETFGERPTVQVSNATYSNIDFNSFDVNFIKGDGSRRLVLARAGSPVNAGPADFTSYIADNTFGQGDQIGSGNYVVYNDFGENFSLQGLDPAVTYYFAFFEYSLSLDGELYLSPAYTSTQSSKTVIDLGVSQIISPVSSCELSTQETVTVEISNYSAFPVDGFQVAYSINDGEPIIENITGTNTITGNGKLTYSFQTKIDLSIDGIYQLKAYTIVGEDIDLSNDSLTASVENFPEMTTTISPDATICKGESILLEATGGVAYSWSNGFVNPSISVSPNETTTYTVVITDENGCKEEQSVTITVIDTIELEFLGTENYISSYVYPEVGTIDSTFTFKVNYKDALGYFPADGYPKVILSSFLNTYELTMTEVDPLDQDVTDGKAFEASVNGLSADATWSTQIIAFNSNGCKEETITQEGVPLVSKRVLDMNIFADDILFSNDKPGIGEVFTITARLNNNSDFPAGNFNVNIYHNLDLVTTIPVSGVEASSIETINYDYSFDFPGRHEVKVFIDEEGVLEEQNPLNNFAIRLYSLPEGITATAYLNKNTYKIGETMYLSGSVNFVGSDVANNAVSGAKVDITLSDGRTFTTFTNSSGVFSFAFITPDTLGDFWITGIADEGRFTATFEIGDSSGGSSGFTVIEADEPILYPDLKTDILINYPENRSYFYKDEVITGVFKLENAGDAIASEFIFDYTNCQGLDVSEFIESIQPGEVIEFPFSTIANTINSCSLLGCKFESFVDNLNSVQEKDENNNGLKRYVNILADLPDLKPTFKSSNYDSFDQTYYYTLDDGITFNVEVKNEGGLDIVNPFNFRVYADGQIFKDTIINNLKVCGTVLLKDLKLSFNDGEDHTILITVDEPLGTGDIQEYREDNNDLTTIIRLKQEKPDLRTEKYNLSVSPKMPLPGEEFNIIGTFINQGETSVQSSYLNKFTVSESGILREQVVNGMSPLEKNISVQSEITTSITEYGNHYVVFDLDVDDTIEEQRELNNSAQMPLCVDLVPSRDPDIGYAYSVWDGNFQVFTQQYLTAYIGNRGLFIPSNVKVHFYLDEILIAETTMDEVPTSYTGRGKYLRVPYIFTESGTFNLKVVVDPDNEYIECNDGDNEYGNLITIKTPGPDLVVLPKYISPTRLNPDLDEPINVFVSFDNIGTVPAGPFKVRLTVDDQPLGQDVQVAGLDAGLSSTVAIPEAYSSSIGGFKTLKAYVDINNDLDDANLRNNVAERQIFVGDASNLRFSSAKLLNECPENNTANTATFNIINEGDVDVEAEVFFYHKIGEDLLDIKTEFILVNARDTSSIVLDYQVLSNTYELFAQIANASPFEYNELDNTISLSYCKNQEEYFTILTDVIGQGTIIKSSEDDKFISGSAISLNAFPAEGWSFTQWSGDITGTQNPYELTIDGNKNVIAEFTENFRIKLNKTNESCFEAADGRLEVDIFAGLAPYTVEWYKNGELLSDSGRIISSLSAGVYEVRVTDSNSVTLTEQEEIIVGDFQYPIVVIPSDVSVFLDQNGLGSLSIEEINDESFDNCGIKSKFFNDGLSTLEFNCTDVGQTILVDFKVEDTNGNVSVKTFKVTVNDTEKPVITNVPSDIIIDNDLNTCGAVVSWTEPNATDNCGIESFAADQANGSIFPVGTTTVTYTATDIHGNTETASFTVTITDNELPVITNVPANISVNNDAGVCGAVVTWTEPIASDNCEIAAFTSDHTSGDEFPVGETTVTYTATDIHGNSETASFTVTVTDNGLPVITNVPANITVNNDTGVCGAVVTWTDPQAADNCGIESFTAVYASGDLFPVGETTVTYTATDIHGNTETASFTVTVTDNELPVITNVPANITVNNDAGICGAVVIWTEPNVADNCGIESFSSDQANGSTFPVGTTTVTYTATDIHGNTETASFTVTVTDNELPV